MLKSKDRDVKRTAVIKPQWKLTPEQAKRAEKLKTEDGKPVDNSKSEKQMRLLTAPLYGNWNPGCDFWAAANVGLFYEVSKPAVVPDIFVSLHVKANMDLNSKAARAYFFWDREKPPEVVIEIVSNKRGGEQKRKLKLYASLGIRYYIIYDPARMLGDVVVQRFVLENGAYRPLTGNWLEDIGLGLSLWQGSFESSSDVWLRWSDQDGVVIPTGDEKSERIRGEADRLRALLKSKGIDPDASIGKQNVKH